MKVSSINSRVAPEDQECIAAYPLEGFFVIETVSEKIYFNGDGREVFRATKDIKTFIQKLKRMLRAN